MGKTFQSLLENLNPAIIAENDEFEVLVLEVDELQSFIWEDKMHYNKLHYKQTEVCKTRA